jgi:DNA-binding NarL/FixJ family response regulator
LEESSKLRLKCWRGVTIDAARQIAASPIDIVLIEAYWSGERAIRCAYLLKRLQPELTVINFADVPTLATCIRCYQAGADAYVTTPQTRQQLEETIQDAILRMHPFPREISKIIAEHWKRRFVLPDRSVLTESEAEVMAAVIQGKFDKEIASDRSTTHGTVHSILHGIYAKIGVHTRAEAVEHFLPLGEAFTIARQLASPNRSI